MEDKPLDISKKTATSNTESQLALSEKQPELEKDKKPMSSNNRTFPQEEISKLSEKSRGSKEQGNLKSVAFPSRNNANKTMVSRNMNPGNSVSTKRKITTVPGINSGAKIHKSIEYPLNPDVKNKPRILADPNYSDTTTRDCICHKPSTSSGASSSFHFSAIQGPSTHSNSGVKSFECVHRDRIGSSPTDLKHSGKRTGGRPTDRKVKDMLIMPDVSVCSERASSEISPRPSTSAGATCSYDSAGVQGHSPKSSKMLPFFRIPCKKGFQQRSSLTIPKRTHTGKMHVQSNSREKRFACKLCDKRYFSSSDLNRHIRVHTGERRFKCDHCDKRFFRNENLKVHTRVHTNERPFVCQICNKGFIRKIYLIDHMRIHTKEKPYICQTCGRGFSQKAHLEYHKNTHKPNRTE